MKIRTYSELIRLPTFEERFDYLKMGGMVGNETFGQERYLNQIFYATDEWKRIRRDVIIRDEGCDLAVPGYTIHDRIYVHHLNPITQDDILKRSEMLLNPEYLICVTKSTHDAIHFGHDRSIVVPVERSPNDTCPWRK